MPIRTRRDPSAGASAAPAGSWRDAALDGAGLAIFMVSATVMTVIVEHPSSPIRQTVLSPLLRRVLIGLAMGATAIALIHSPWGRRSGAHLNPAVTVAFARLGKVPVDAARRYVTAQFVGGLAGSAFAAWLCAPWVAHPSVAFITTRPGPAGVAGAFAGELLISFLMMSMVLALGSRPAAARYTGLVSGALVAAFITVEAPISGMSMNPARSLGPGVLSGLHDGLWLYFVAPVAGMWLAADAARRGRTAQAVRCPVMHHGPTPCAFCGAGPDPHSHSSSSGWQTAAETAPS